VGLKAIWYQVNISLFGCMNLRCGLKTVDIFSGIVFIVFTEFLPYE